MTNDESDVAEAGLVAPFVIRHCLPERILWLPAARKNAATNMGGVVALDAREVVWRRLDNPTDEGRIPRRPREAGGGIDGPSRGSKPDGIPAPANGDSNPPLFTPNGPKGSMVRLAATIHPGIWNV